MADVVVTELAFDRAWNVRGNHGAPAFVAAVAEAFGLPLPVQPNSSTARGDHGAQDGRRGGARVANTLLWLGPASWLFVGSRDSHPSDFDAARKSVNAAGGALFDVSASYVGWLVAGVDAGQTLNRGCPLDFDSRVFGAGHCAQSLLGHVAATFHRPDASPAFIVLVARSFAADVQHDLEVWSRG